MPGQLRQRTDVQSTDARIPGTTCSLGLRLPVDVKIDRLDAGRRSCWIGGAGREFDLLAVDHDAFSRKLNADSPGHVFEFERRQISGQAQIDVLERNVACDRTQFAVGELNPGMERAAAVRQRDGIIDPLLPDRQVRRLDFGKELPRPRRRTLDAAPAQIAAHIDARCGFAGR